MNGMLEGKVAMVTGAARGIGRAIAQRLHQDGAAVAVADLDLDAARNATECLGELGLAVALDVSDPASAEAAARTVADRFEGIDILVNNAGIAGLAAPVSEYPIEEWRRVMSANLDGVFYCTRAVLPYLLRRDWGRVVNISSISGKEGNPNMAAYSTSKAGVIGFTKSLGKELARSGVRVNCVTPAVIATELLEQLDDQTVDYMVSKIPMGRTGRLDEIAAMVAWLASPECSFSTGAVFDLSGGRATY